MSLCLSFREKDTDRSALTLPPRHSSHLHMESKPKTRQAPVVLLHSKRSNFASPLPIGYSGAVGAWIIMDSAVNLCSQPCSHPSRNSSFVSLTSSMADEPPNPHLHRAIFPLLNSLYNDPEYLSTVHTASSSRYGSYAYPSYKARGAKRRHSAHVGQLPKLIAEPEDIDQVIERGRKDGGRPTRDQMVTVRPPPLPLPPPPPPLPRSTWPQTPSRLQAKEAQNHIFSENFFGIREDPGGSPCLSAT